MSEYRVTADLCICEICLDTRASTCLLRHHTCCAEWDSIYLAAYANDAMLD
ncbi:MAG TPA: hypothetical protein VN739_05410 [Nitrososphaerales archaeon]|nr:hypothetical protein [Nitrososphaerales archaeon]